jgi:hypothetical protein
MRAEEGEDLSANLFEGGAISALLRTRDWSQTPLEAVETWSESVKMTVQVLLTALDRAKQPETAPLEREADQPQACRSAAVQQAAQAAAFRVRLANALRPLTDANEIQALAARLVAVIPLG